MRARSQFALLFLFLLSPLARVQDALPSKSSEGSQPLEIRLVRPPLWHDHYLEITIKWVNRSKSRIFFSPASFENVEIYSSVTQAKSMLELDGPETWILVYGGPSDSISSEVRTLAPGNEDQNTYYIRDTFPVRDMVTNATRQIGMQGRLRILARYEQKVPKRKTNRQQQEGMKRTAPTHEVDSGSRSRGQTTLEIQIPCPVGAVKTDCSTPPPIFAGEHIEGPIFLEAPVL